MIVNTMSSAFGFGILRNPKPTEVIGFLEVMPSSVFVQDLITINESSDSDAQKLDATNLRLKASISIADFIKTKTEFFSIINPTNPNPSGMQADMEKMYDNVIVRLLI